MKYLRVARLEGYLKKHVKELKLFQRKKFYKRYYILDFDAATLIVKHDAQDSDDSTNN